MKEIPIRKQRKRTKGWRMKPNSIFVGRTGSANKFANPFKVEAIGGGKFCIINTIKNTRGVTLHKSKQAAVKVACQMHTYFIHQQYPTDLELITFLRPLVEKEILYCWCREDQQCHADYYIQLLQRFFYGGDKIIDYDIFLDKESPCDLTNRKHIAQNVTYYSNGHLVIAVENRGEDQKEDISDEFSIILLSRPFATTRNYKAPPQYAAPEARTCEDCKGSGYIEICPECTGEGWIEFKNKHNTYYPSCKTCDGEAVVQSKKENEYSKRCNLCDGAGKYNNWGNDYYDKLLNIGGYLFDKNLLEELKLLPLFAIQSSDPDQKSLQFSFFGGKGILMGCSQAPEEND